MIDGSDASNILADTLLMRCLTTVWTTVWKFPINDFLNARNVELRHEREIPAQGLAESVFQGHCFTNFVSIVRSEHSAYFDKVREGVAC